MAPKPESESYLPILSVHCDDLDSVDETPAEQTHAFLENAPLDCGSGNEVFHLENPRAGGVRTPFASTPTMGHSGTPRSPSSRRLVRHGEFSLAPCSFVRLWTTTTQIQQTKFHYRMQELLPEPHTSVHDSPSTVL
ncbi:hypothetical protein TcBrA4_0015760 [Trypanosoma cruzi]|nr:hypothetical protein TcBrA4_0015760 [Trypanosoma cruzi]